MSGLSKLFGGVASKVQTTLVTPPSGARAMQPKSDGWWDVDSSGNQNLQHMSRRVVKTLATSRSSNITVSNDPDLTLTLEVARWRIKGMLWVYSTSATPGFKMDLGATAWTIADGPFLFIQGGSSPVMGGAGANISIPVANVQNGTAIMFEGILNNTGAGNVLAVRWAQSVSNLAPTQVMAGSWMEATKLP